MWPEEEQRHTLWGLPHPGRQCEDWGSKKEEPMEEPRAPAIYTGLEYLRPLDRMRPKRPWADRGSTQITKDSEYRQCNDGVYTWWDGLDARHRKMALRL